MKSHLTPEFRPNSCNCFIRKDCTSIVDKKSEFISHNKNKHFNEKFFNRVNVIIFCMYFFHQNLLQQHCNALITEYICVSSKIIIFIKAAKLVKIIATKSPFIK